MVSSSDASSSAGGVSAAAAEALGPLQRRNDFTTRYGLRQARGIPAPGAPVACGSLQRHRARASEVGEGAGASDVVGMLSKPWTRDCNTSSTRSALAHMFCQDARRHPHSPPYKDRCLPDG